MLFPYPFDLMILVFKFGYIVNFIAGFDDGFQIFRRFEFPGIDHHGPLFGFQRLVVFFYLDTMGVLISPSRCKSVQYGSGRQTQRRNTGQFQKASSAVFHYSISFGLSIWQSQQYGLTEA